MKLDPHVQELAKVPQEMLDYLMQVCAGLDLASESSLTKEEAFYDTCHRYDAETEFFNQNHNPYSGVPPSKELAIALRPYYEYLLTIPALADSVIYRSQIVRNLPGAVVKPHIDLRLYHKVSHRVHCVLKTNDRARHVYYDSEYNMEVHKMEAGLLYDFDNITPHSVFNLGSTDRLHVITDVMPRAQFQNLRALFIRDPNRIATGVEQSYRFHVQNIEARYPDLKTQYNLILNTA